MIYTQLIDALRSQGLKHIECTGKKFDPYYHEVLLAEECDNEPNKIMEELQKGYMLNDKVIRHSKVKIAKKKKEMWPEYPETGAVGKAGMVSEVKDDESKYDNKSYKSAEDKKKDKGPAGVDHGVVNSKT